MALTDVNGDEGCGEGSPKSQDLCCSAPFCGSAQTHPKSEGFSELTRDLGETQLAFSIALLSQSSWVFPPSNACPRFTLGYTYYHLFLTPPPTSLMRSIGARRSWPCHLPTLGQLKSVPSGSFQRSGSSVSSQYNTPLRCRQGWEYRSSPKWGANNSSAPCSPTLGGQRGPDPAQRHWHAGTYPLHIPAPPLSALPQPRPRAQPTLPGHQSCPAACQSLPRRSVPLAAKVRGSAPPQPFPCPGRVTCPRGGPRPRARPRPSSSPALSL